MLSRKYSKHLINIENTGSPAAAFQSAFYGAFTPAGGVFAILTSLGMMAYLTPTIMIIIGSVALCAFLVWQVYEYNKDPNWPMAC